MAADVTEAQLQAWEREHSHPCPRLGGVRYWAEHGGQEEARRVGVSDLIEYYDALLLSHCSLAARLAEETTNLKKYGQHRPLCVRLPLGSLQPTGCTCGFLAALAPGPGA